LQSLLRYFNEQGEPRSKFIKKVQPLKKLHLKQID